MRRMNGTLNETVKSPRRMPPELLADEALRGSDGDRFREGQGGLHSGNATLSLPPVHLGAACHV